jgi:DNA-binding transcriptional ArsR family regulator
MAFSKAHLFGEEDQALSQFARALSHPARTGILLFLMNHGPTTVEDLSKGYPLAQSTISQHLEILRKAGFLDCWEDYPHTYYKPHFATLDTGANQMINFCSMLINPQKKTGENNPNNPPHP